MLRVLVTGGRDYFNRRHVEAALGAIHRKRGISLLIEGDASGVDTLAREWAEANGVEVKPFPADWKNLSHPDARIRRNRRGELYDANAGSRRNAQMLREGRPDAVVAFPGRTGTANMCRLAKEAGLEPWRPKAPPA